MSELSMSMQRPLEVGSRRAVFGVGVGVVTDVQDGIAVVSVPSTWVPGHAIERWEGPFYFNADTWERIEEASGR